MSTIRFVRPEHKMFESAQDLVADGRVDQAVYDGLPEGERSIATFSLHSGGPDEPQLFEARVPPNGTVEPHAHAHDEIIFVVAGELRFGAQVCPVGTTVFVPRLTLYSFRAGPAGCGFLNFRAKSDYGYISKPELLALRARTDFPQ